MSSSSCNFGGLPEEYTSYKAAKAAILPIPYEGTVSYGGGTALGPDAIIKASMNMELYDEELHRDTYEIGIHTLAAVKGASSPSSMIKSIRDSAIKVLRDGKFLVSLGGEHSITKGVLDAFIEVRGNDFGVLQLDAHADLRDSYDDTPHSHACIMKRVHELGLTYSQVGIRSLSREEADFISEGGQKIYFAHKITGKTDWMEQVMSDLPDKVYVTIDIDVLDPSIMPSTGTPEPGGLDWYTTTHFLRKVSETKEIIGFDVVELAPIKDLPAPDFLTAKLVYKLLGYAIEA
ncbi:MAG: agmatinase [Proteobacteria bacterium]|nr:agmatinase [Pseudomonadota bacterium]